MVRSRSSAYRRNTRRIITVAAASYTRCGDTPESNAPPRSRSERESADTQEFYGLAHLQAELTGNFVLRFLRGFEEGFQLLVLAHGKEARRVQ